MFWISELEPDCFGINLKYAEILRISVHTNNAITFVAVYSPSNHEPKK